MDEAGAEPILSPWHRDEITPQGRPLDLLLPLGSDGAPLRDRLDAPDDPGVRLDHPRGLGRAFRVHARPRDRLLRARPRRRPRGQPGPPVRAAGDRGRPVRAGGPVPAPRGRAALRPALGRLPRPRGALDPGALRRVPGGPPASHDPHGRHAASSLARLLRPRRRACRDGRTALRGQHFRGRRGDLPGRLRPAPEPRHAPHDPERGGGQRDPRSSGRPPVALAPPGPAGPGQLRRARTRATRRDSPSPRTPHPGRGVAGGLVRAGPEPREAAPDTAPRGPAARDGPPRLRPVGLRGDALRGGMDPRPRAHDRLVRLRFHADADRVPRGAGRGGGPVRAAGRAPVGGRGPLPRPRARGGRPLPRGRPRSSSSPFPTCSRASSAGPGARTCRCTGSSSGSAC